MLSIDKEKLLIDVLNEDSLTLENVLLKPKCLNVYILVVEMYKASSFDVGIKFLFLSINETFKQSSSEICNRAPHSFTQ